VNPFCIENLIIGETKVRIYLMIVMKVWNGELGVVSVPIRYVSKNTNFPLTPHLPSQKKFITIIFYNLFFTILDPTLYNSSSNWVFFPITLSIIVFYFLSVINWINYLPVCLQRWNKGKFNFFLNQVLLYCGKKNRRYFPCYGFFIL